MAALSEERPRQIRIVLIDDHPMVRERLTQLIQEQPDLVVCGEAADHRQGLLVVQQCLPHLVLVDLTLKQSHGLDLIKDLHIQFPALPLLVISMHDESLYGERVLRAGARGYITKQEATRSVLQAIRTVLAGNIYLSERATARLTAKIAGLPRSHAGLSIDALTDRELRVFELLGQGNSTRQIAQQLHLEMRTIETYRARIKVKLQLADGNQLLQHAIRWVQSA